MSDQPTTLTINGKATPLGMVSDEPLVRAVLISLFTWRRAAPDDDLPAQSRNGWWGDSFPPAANDRIGSRLWLLTRSKLTTQTVTRAREYAEEALKWLVDDGVATRVEVESLRLDIQTLGLACRIYKNDGRQPTDIRFANLWEFLNV